MTSISLNELAGNINTSTHEGGDLSDFYYWEPEDLTAEEIEQVGYAITREGTQKALKDNCESCFSFLIEPMAKYGITVQDFHFFMPREYNFISDSVDMKFEADDQPIDPELYPYIQTWLDNKPRSSDGYMDLQPDTVEEADKEDYCFLNAIIEKEELKEKLHDAFSDFIEQAREDLDNYYWSLVPEKADPTPATVTECPENAV